ncbi:MAG: insulinase family protein, partial [bacterium]|nr:insulinase family protein [bacterium]
YRFKSDPEKFAQRLIYSAVFPGTRIGGLTTGDVDDIKIITQSSILSYYQRTHCAKNMVLSVCGNISEKQVLSLSQKYFGNLKSGEKLYQIKLRVVPEKEPVLEIIPSLKQTVLSIGYQGFRSEDKDHYVADILSVLLTRGKSSRLYYEIREKRALAYIVNSNNFNGRNTGIFTIQVGLANDKVLECLNIIKTELKKVTSGDLPEDELNKVMAFVRSNIAFSFENSLFEASYYSKSWCFTGTVQPIEEEFNNYESIVRTPSLIQETARKMFSVRPAILIIGQGMTKENQNRIINHGQRNSMTL